MYKMKITKALLIFSAIGVVFLSTAFFADAQQQEESELQNHSECSLFSGKEHDKHSKEARDRFWRGDLTEQVTAMRGDSKPNADFKRMVVPGGSRTGSLQDLASMSTIDKAIFAELQSRNIAPADKTTDYEFLRRVTLDLTGRTPAFDRIVFFANSESPTKRADLINELLNSPEWVDKWTMFFGDLYRNTSNSDVLPRREQGRNAFYGWIKASLAANKPYNQIATELIAAKGTNSFEAAQGNINWLVGSQTTGGPLQDNYDQEMADTAATFLGIGHLNCVLCHDGRGHLDSLSLWGKSAKRSSAWAMSSYYARLNIGQTRPDPSNNNLRYYSLNDTGRTDYALNTTTGNRPARQPVDGLSMTVRPSYMFGKESPIGNENNRDALARAVTNDFQFARATVNYMWAALMGRGLVEPLDQFDPARLDPENPPTGSWTLQPSNAALLNSLADEFRQNKYDLKWLMRTIANSEAYQLSSRYNGNWNSTLEPTFARHLVRRLWAEEIHDSIAVASGILPTYNVAEFGGAMYIDRTVRPVRFAMQLPEPANLPDGGNGAVTAFLNSFGRGNRLDDDRKGDGSPLQALNLMNDNFVMTRIRSSNTGGQQSLLNRSINMADEQMVNQFFLQILARYPSRQELDAAVATLRGTTGTTRLQRGENLIWTLFNKVDFIYNY